MKMSLKPSKNPKRIWKKPKKRTRTFSETPKAWSEKSRKPWGKRKLKSRRASKRKKRPPKR